MDSRTWASEEEDLGAAAAAVVVPFLDVVDYRVDDFEGHGLHYRFGRRVHRCHHGLVLCLVPVPAAGGHHVPAAGTADDLLLQEVHALAVEAAVVEEAQLVAGVGVELVEHS